MYDNTPLSLDEITDHCRALVYAIIEVEDSTAKEILTFILWERIDLLYRTLDMPID
ncbi:hypothetical protein J8631_11405 [Serratia fonticola]|uniref:hypothetical protein n=1 Tax=Serratia fonticola TaxID=47917 RepID=UPI001AE74D45|nr:hypothetical protein [Serratia fonticola]MBP1036162.1 hypothetical protein [Serratia fonticola]